MFMLHNVWIFSVFLILCSFLLYVYFSNSRKRKLLLKVPSLKPRALIGNLYEAGLLRSSSTPAFYAKPLEFLLGQNLLHGDQGVYVVWMGPKPVVFLTKPSTAQTILSSSIFTGKGSTYNIIKQWLGNSLLMSSGAKYQRDRKLLTPAFNFGIVSDFVPMIHEQSAIFVSKLNEKTTHRDYIDPQELITLCTIDIICETALGVKLGAQSHSSDYAEAVHQTVKAFLYRLFRPWLHLDWVFFFTKVGERYRHFIRQQQAFTEQVISKRMTTKDKCWKANGENGDLVSKERLALLDTLLKHDFKALEVRDQAVGFIFAGHDTTSVTMIWTLYMIGLELEAQNKLVDELDSLLNETEKSLQQLTQDDLKKLSFMDRFIKECQRLFPAVPVISRNVQEDTKIGDYLIPKHTEVAISIISVHRDPDTYPNPEKFDPDRFLPENSFGRHPYALIPFSAGPRNCMGQKYAVVEVKILLCHILRAFHIKSLDHRDKVLFVPEVVLRPLGEVRIKFTPRTIN